MQKMLKMLNLIYLLVWKNCRIKLRHPLVLLLEIGLPCLFCAVLAILRVMIAFNQVTTPTVYPPLPLDDFQSVVVKSILYAPKSTETEEIMNIFSSSTAAANFQVLGFDTEKELIKHYADDETHLIMCGIVFQDIKSDLFDVKLRYPFSTQQSGGFSLINIDSFTWLTARLYPMFQEPGPRSPEHVGGGPPAYFSEGFLYVQHQLSRSFAIYRNPNITELLDQIQVNVQRFPYPPYIDDKFLFSLQFLFPLILMLSFIYPSVNLTKSIVLEKEERLKEMMKMMGLSDWLHWTSWFTNSFGQSLLSIVIVTILLCVPLSQGQAILTKSNPFIVFLFFVLYIVSSISFCFFLSTLFSRANIAGVIAGAVYFVSILPYFQIFMSYNQLSFSVKMATGLIFNTNMALGCMLISMWESQHLGVQWENLFEAASPDDDFPIFYVFLMFVIDSIVYFVLAIYIQNVFPGQYGYAKKWYYFVDPNYWKCSSLCQKYQQNLDIEMNQSGETTSTVRIDNLSKSYDKGKTFAVNQLSLDIKQNEITVLLGHNGAGKTTLMSILCGLLPPTSGSIHVGQWNLIKDLDAIRKDIGICPQFDILFDHLTVQEHFWFYCKLKCIENSRIQCEIDKMLKLLDLDVKRDNLAHTLSGGMKRKLSVGIALVGGSKFVLLDEATSGMDVSARRFIWNLLLKEKRNRSILLSTHFMEEADVLGDKIAIVEQGKLKCFGSPMELKKQYGLGYLLTLAVQEDQVNAQLIDDKIKFHVHNAKLLSSVGAEITYSLPDGERHKFESLFKEIEANMSELNILNYGISVTTIEEVFLRVGDFAKQGTEQFNNFTNLEVSESNSSTVNPKSLIDRIKPNSLKMVYGFDHIYQTYQSLFAKKLLFFIRNPFLIFSQLALPTILLLIAILINNQLLKQTTLAPALHLSSLHPYKNIQITAFHDSNVETGKILDLYQKYVSKNSNVQFNKHKVMNSSESIGHLLDYARNHASEYNINYLLSAIFAQDGDRMNITALFNNQAYHTAPTSLAVIDSTILKYVLDNPQIEFHIWNEPFPEKAADEANSREFSTTTEIQLSISVLFSTCFLLASFIILLVKEKCTNFKHIQQIGGLRLFYYWSSSFLLDFGFYFVSTCGMVIVIALYSMNGFNSAHQIGILITVFIMNGFSALPCIYLFSILFKDPATAYVRVSLYLLIGSVTTFLVVLILQIPDFDMIDISRLVDRVIFFLPLHGLPMSLYTISENYKAQEFCLQDLVFGNVTVNIQNLCHDPKLVNATGKWTACCKDRCEKWCYEWEEDYYAMQWPGIGLYMLAFYVQGVIYWIILALLEYDKLTFLWFKNLFNSVLTLMKIKKQNAQKHDELQTIGDDDVQEEEKRIQFGLPAQLAQTDSMIVQNLSKKYGDFCAVNNVSFGVRKAECFGLLGVNGAGKTTTFKMITGAIKMTSGNVWINGRNTREDMNAVYKNIGYCPQFDGLLDQLTGRETLRIISKIRGIDSTVIDDQIDALSQLLYFAQHIDKKVNSYSGGTKRKLSFAISILGNPMIVFLDEPTTGVDPVSRRCLWNAIQVVRAAGSSIVLTSHSMEECEALCNRLQIMVNAKIRCLGSPLHLKQKYGAGYIVQIKLNSTANSAKIVEMLNSRWHECVLESEYNNLLTFKIESNNVKLSELFGEIERIKQGAEKSGDSEQIEDYSICQTSIESIFLSFAGEK